MVYAKYFGSYKGISKKDNEFYTLDLIADTIVNDSEGKPKKKMMQGVFCTKDAYLDAQKLESDTYCEVDYGINEYGQPVICGLSSLIMED